MSKGTWKQSRKRKKIPLETLQLRITHAFEKLERIIQDDSYNPKDVHAIINACNSLANLAKKYAEIEAVSEMQQKMEKFEQQLEKRN